MFDMPEHAMMAVDEHGNGPVNDTEAKAYRCWCADPKCTNLQHVYSEAGGRMCEDMAAEGMEVPELDHPTIPGFCATCHAYMLGLMRLLHDRQEDDEQ